MKKFLSVLLLLTLFSVVPIFKSSVLAQEPTAEPTDDIAIDAVQEPTDEPTAEPTDEPTAEPTVEPTVEPTDEPTAEPTVEPTVEPTDEPTVEPTDEPTTEPTDEPIVELPEIVSFVADPSVITLEASKVATTTLSWDVTGAVTTTLDGVVVTDLEQVVEVAGTTTFVLSAENEAGVVEAETVVSVVEATIDTAGDINAQATPLWLTNMAVMNISNSANQFSISYYNQSGATVNSLGYGSPKNLGAYASVRIPASDINATTFSGSGVIEASGEIAAAVRVVDSANGSAFDMYSGASSLTAGTQLYVPIIHRMKNSGWYGLLSVQNTSSSDTANVTVKYRTRGSQTVVYSENFSLKPNAAHYSDMQNSQYNVLNTNSGIANWVGTVEIVSNNNVPLVAREVQSNISNNLRGVHESSLSSDAGNKFFIPLVQGRSKNKGGNGWTGYLLVMNVSNSPINVTAKFVKSNGTTSGSKTVQSLAPFDSYEFTPDEIPAIANDANWIGSAIVTSGGANQLFLAEMTNVNNKPPKNNYYLYKGSKDGATAKTLYFPYQESNNLVNYNVVQNVGSGSTNITFRYFNLSGTQVRSQTVSNVGSGVSFERSTNVDENLSNFQGSLLITSSSQPIEGYSTMCNTNNTSSGYDSCGTYTGVK